MRRGWVMATVGSRVFLLVLLAAAAVCSEQQPGDQYRILLSWVEELGGDLNGASVQLVPGMGVGVVAQVDLKASRCEYTFMQIWWGRPSVLACYKSFTLNVLVAYNQQLVICALSCGPSARPGGGGRGWAHAYIQVAPNYAWVIGDQMQYYAYDHS